MSFFSGVRVCVEVLGGIGFFLCFGKDRFGRGFIIGCCRYFCCYCVSRRFCYLCVCFGVLFGIRVLERRGSVDVDFFGLVVGAYACLVEVRRVVFLWIGK